MKLWQYPGIGTWYIYFDRNNKKSLKTKDKKEAQILFRKYQKDLLEGKISEIHNSEKFSVFKQSCLTNYKATKTLGTFQRMEYTLKAFEDFIGDKDISKITKRDIDRFVELRLGQGLAKTTINIDIRNLKATFSKAYEWELLPKNTLQGYKQLKIDRKAPQFLNLEDINKIADVIDSPVIKSAFFFYILSGCRRDELLNLTWQDIDLKNRVIHVKKSKTHLDRWIPINDSLMEVIEQIPHRIGKLYQMHHDTITHKMKKYMIKAGYPEMKLHNLRHTFASLIAMSGSSLQTIRDLLGHTDIKTTEIYAHLTHDHLKAAVSKIKIDISNK